MNQKRARAAVKLYKGGQRVALEHYQESVNICRLYGRGSW